MSFRCFGRKVWQAKRSWPNRFEPLATPMDRCRTLHTAYTRQEAVDWCTERNKKWYKHIERVRLGTASPTQINTYYTASRYEFTEEQ